ncbi:MAG: hypothetical protein AB1925_30025 [Actinomycetota bacterium]
MRENSATVPAVQPSPTTPPPLPPGAAWDGEWAPDPPNQPYRIIHGRTRSVGRRIQHWGDYVTGTVEVETSACQNFDGTLAADDPPQIHVNSYSDTGITPDEARGVAALLLEAAAEIESWSAR